MILDKLRGAVVVSCQAPEGNPLRTPAHMAAMARAAELGGARGIRAEGAADIAAIKARCALPVIGIRKIHREGCPVFITPTFDDAVALAGAGADLIAADGTERPRPGGETLPELIRRVHDELGVPVMADVDSLESGLFAADSGADLIATTLSGYTGSDHHPDEPDLELVRALSETQPVPVVAEGRIWSPDHVAGAFAAGAFAVVVGTAITNPVDITRRFVAAVPRTLARE
ncbi:N-acetylmannosamine-6-phosphate 2-epimerase [Nonomuraea sp. NPDC000554]|uniref:N-acetylmannosamine-6-phosphate 2-epimerase n=1 Tax=Nonomuraea sp. NPDC000554 TaxID=3154259 RepID=UPI003324EF37